MEAAALGTELTGDLCCARCRYNLRGLSVRGVCPECATPVAATLLRVIDPQAAELQPIAKPGLTATGLVLWSAGAVAAVLIVWLFRAAEALDWLQPPLWTPWLLLACMLASAIGGLSMVRPHAGIPRARQISAIGSFLAYVTLAWVTWQIVVNIDGPRGRPYIGGGDWSVRWIYKVAATLLLGMTVLGIQPVFRTLQSRSYLLRTGKLERQTLRAILASIGVILVGDMVQGAVPLIQPSFPELPRLAAMCLTGVGSLLLAIGLVGLAIDVRRLMPVILSAPLGLTDVLSTPRQPTGTESTRPGMTGMPETLS